MSGSSVDGTSVVKATQVELVLPVALLSEIQWFQHSQWCSVINGTKVPAFSMVQGYQCSPFYRGNTCHRCSTTSVN